MDTVGAFAGPLLAIALMTFMAGNIRAVLAIAVIPALVAVAILIAAVHEPQPHAVAGRRPRLDRQAISALPATFWSVVALGAVMAMARVSEAFLILKADAVGVSAAYVPFVLVILNVVYAVTAWPAGVLSDRVGRRGLLVASLGVLVVALGLLAGATTLMGAVGGIVLWGLHMGLSQGLLAAAIADTAPKALRGTAFGVFNLVGGLATLVSNSLAGVLWAKGGPEWAFGAAGLAALVALILAIRRG